MKSSHPMNLSKIFSEKSLKVYCIESLVVTSIVACIYLIRFLFDNDDDDFPPDTALFKPPRKSTTHTVIEIIMKFVAFFLLNVLLFIFLDMIIPSLSTSIRGGYGYLIGVTIMSILMTSVN